MSTADLLYGDVEQHLRESVRRLFADQAKPTKVVVTYDLPTDFSELSETLLGDIGAAGMLISEELGGAGASIREAAVIAEEIGYAVAPTPFLTSSVIATVTLTNCNERGLLTDLAAGKTTAAVAVSFAAPDLPEALDVRSTNDGLNGSIRSVAGADTADVLLVPAASADGLELHAVTTDAANGVAVIAVPTFDMTRPVSDITFTNASSRRLDCADVRGAINLGLRAGAGVVASEQLGVATWCLETTIEYVKQRHQFGRAIGSFQALKHRLADLSVEVGHAGAAARYAADTLARDDSDADVAVAVAKSFCSTAAVHAAEECVQMHGGSGMTWENPAHLYLKRAKANEIALGNSFRHRARLGDLLGLPPQ
jgi:alkylation response protein AidB-like acyl-CoA dehydrogenase